MIPPEYQNWRSRTTVAAVWIASLLSVAALVFRCRHFLGSGRIWAEDGTVFLPAMLEHRSLLFLYNGHFEGWANLVAWLASFVELEHSARVLTWFALLIAASVPLLGVALWRLEVIGLRALLVFVTLSAALPEVVEPLANAANLHFYAVYFTWFVLLLPPRFTWWPAALVFGCGFSGVPACLLVPAFALVAWRTRDPEHLRRLVLLALPALGQLALLAVTGPGRALTTSIAAGFRAVAFHLVTVPLTSTAADRLNGPALQVLAVVLLGLLTARVLLSRSLPGRLTLFAGLVVAAVSVVAPHGGGAVIGEFEAVLGGARYFAVPSALVLTALAMTGGARWWAERLLSVCLGGICLVQLGTGLFVTISGPPWPDALARARDARASRVAIWPEGWFMPLNGRGEAVASPGRGE